MCEISLSWCRVRLYCVADEGRRFLDGIHRSPTHIRCVGRCRTDYALIQSDKVIKARFMKVSNTEGLT